MCGIVVEYNNDTRLLSKLRHMLGASWQPKESPHSRGDSLGPPGSTKTWHTYCGVNANDTRLLRKLSDNIIRVSTSPEKSYMTVLGNQRTEVAYHHSSVLKNKESITHPPTVRGLATAQNEPLQVAGVEGAQCPSGVLPGESISVLCHNATAADALDSAVRIHQADRPPQRHHVMTPFDGVGVCSVHFLMESCHEEGVRAGLTASISARFRVDSSTNGLLTSQGDPSSKCNNLLALLDNKAALVQCLQLMFPGRAEKSNPSGGLHQQDNAQLRSTLLECVGFCLPHFRWSSNRNPTRHPTSGYRDQTYDDFLEQPMTAQLPFDRSTSIAVLRICEPANKVKYTIRILTVLTPLTLTLMLPATMMVE
eukprot:gene19957-biopygen840